MIRKQSPERLEKLEKRLAKKLESTTGFTKRIIQHMEGLHSGLLDELQRTVEEGSFSAEGYAKFLVQAWYHTRHTPDFEERFTNCLREHLASRSERLDGSGSDFPPSSSEEGVDRMRSPRVSFRSLIYPAPKRSAAGRPIPVLFPAARHGTNVL